MSRRATTDVSILTSGHDVADARLHRLTAALVRAGRRVEVLGLGDPASAPPGAERVRTWARRGPLHRGWLAAALPWRASGSVLVALDPDVLVSASLSARLRRRVLVADVHEDYLALTHDRPWSPPKRAVARAIAGMATTAARHSDLTVVVDDHVPPLDAAQRLVVRNLPDPAMLPTSASRDPRPRAVYIGDIRESRGLTAMLDVLAASSEWTLDLVGPVAPADAPSLAARLSADRSLAERVRLHGRMPPEQSWRIASGAWVGFCLLEPTPAFVSATASKLYEYVAVGIIPIVTDLPRQRELVERAGSGYVVDGVGDAVAVLAKAVAAPAALDEQSARGQQWAAANRSATSSYDEFARAVGRLADG